MEVFISYSSRNRRIVSILANDLETAEYSVWLDVKQSGGQEWWAEILNNIRECDFVILALSSNFLKSEPCKREYEYAFALNKRIVPVRLSDVNNESLPTLIQKLQVVDFQYQNKEQALRLIKALKNQPTGKPPPNPLPTEPEIPLSPLTILRDEAEGLIQSEDGQRILVSKLHDILRHSSTLESWNYLEQLLKRKDVRVDTQEKLDDLLKVKPKNLTSHAEQSVILESRTFIGHQAEITGVAISSDNKYVVTASHDFTARLWDSITGQEIRRFIGHQGKLTSVQLSPDEKTILTGSEDGTARLWSIEDGELVVEYSGHEGTVTSVAFSPDGEHLVTGSHDKTAKLWDVVTGKELFTFSNHTNWILAVAYSPDKRFVLTGGDKVARLWDTKSGKFIGQFEGHTGFIRSVAFDLESKSILTLSDDQTIRIWDIETYKLLQPLVGPSGFYAAAFSPVGDLICGGSVNQSIVWSRSNGEVFKKLDHNGSLCYAIAFSSDGQFILIGLHKGTARLIGLDDLPVDNSLN